MRYTSIPSFEVLRYVHTLPQQQKPYITSQADVASVMCAYNRFNETSACHNAGLLGSNGLLRVNGFNGTHVTCYFDLVSYHVQGML